ncbi:MAG: hypothetical protein NUV77_11120 [Thermoguttaceae bacterium]|jgi:hypothetical protein|nr:hypothetical protein [Thermoguttaceae bacterium]
MTAAPQPEHVRRLVQRVFQELGVPAAPLDELAETLLIEDRRYLARSYRAGELWAMWLIDLGVVQFYDADGRMLRTLNLFHELEPQRAAA